MLERIRRAYPSLGLICWRVLPACGIVPCRGLSTAVSSARLGPQRSAGCRLCSPATPRRAAPRPVRIRCTRRMPSDAAVIQRSPAIVRGAGTFAVSAQSPISTDMRRQRETQISFAIAARAGDAALVFVGKGIICQIWIQRSAECPRKHARLADDTRSALVLRGTGEHPSPGGRSGLSSLPSLSAQAADQIRSDQIASFGIGSGFRASNARARLVLHHRASAYSPAPSKTST